MKFSVIFLALFFTSLFTNAQVVLQIEGFGRIICPSQMEVQSGLYKTYVEKTKEINGIAASKVILQQKGLNDGIGGFDTYSRIMINTNYGNFNSINIKPSYKETSEVNTIIKAQTFSEAYQNNVTILSWNDAISTFLNGYPAIKYGYKRKINTNPTVNVETYYIQNSSKVYTITFESRTDNYSWSTIFSGVKKSIIIN